MTEQVKQDCTGADCNPPTSRCGKAKTVRFQKPHVGEIERNAQLDIGSEIVQGNLERVITVSVGDNLHQMIASEILVEDGKIIAFRS